MGDNRNKVLTDLCKVISPHKEKKGPCSHHKSQFNIIQIYVTTKDECGNRLWLYWCMTTIAERL